MSNFIRVHRQCSSSEQLINVDHIVEIRQAGDQCGTHISMSSGNYIWICESFPEVFDMICDVAKVGYVKPDMDNLWTSLMEGINREENT